MKTMYKKAHGPQSHSPGEKMKKPESRGNNAITPKSGALTLNGNEPEVTLTREEIIDHLQDGAKRRLKMPARKLVRLYRRGKLEDPGRVADLLALSDLLPDDDPIFGNSHP